MYELIPRFFLFALIVSAPSWRGLQWRAAIGVLLLVAAFGWATEWRFSLVVPGGDANIGAGIVLFYGIMWLASGLISRTISLLARRFGHNRPRSLWIEGLGFFALPLVLDRLLVGG
jgi:hypothetical protein